MSKRFLDVISYSLGTPLTELAFPWALPAPVTSQTTSWSVAEVADETELAEGVTKDAIEEINASTARPARRVPRDFRSRYRGWLRRWVSAAAGAGAAVVEALLLTSAQADARLATPSAVAAIVDLARDALVDPNAEALAGLMAEGLGVEDRDGVWVVSGGTRNPMRLAARVVTELVAPKGVAVVASNGVRSIIIVRRGQVLAMADSTVRRWRIYQVLPPSTPASIFNGNEGVPPARQTAPLLPVPAEVLTLGVDMDVDVGRLVGNFLPSAVRNAHGGSTDWDW